jgi:hypothetical protein
VYKTIFFLEAESLQRECKMPNRNNHWVSQREDGRWADKREGADRASGLYNTQQEAFEAARDAAMREGGEVFIKNREGQIRDRNTYGQPDNFPPEG